MFELKSTAIYFAKKILCGNEEICNQKVENYNHPDFLYITTEELTIKKQQIEMLLRKMNQKPIESEFKVYVIEAFDKLTVQGENSILKFLEEPPPNTIALLLTTKKDQILPTILSRCQLVHLKPSSKINFIKILEKEEISTPIAHTLSFVTSDKEEALEWINEYNFVQLRKSVLKLANLIVKDQDMAMIYLIECVKIANTRPLQQLFLTCLNAYFEDILHSKIQLDFVFAYPELKEHLNTISGQLTVQQISTYLEVITEANRKLSQNVNAMLTFEQMIINGKR